MIQNVVEEEVLDDLQTSSGGDDEYTKMLIR
jgi:hypothetical protein